MPDDDDDDCCCLRFVLDNCGCGPLDDEAEGNAEFLLTLLERDGIEGGTVALGGFLTTKEGALLA